MTQSSFVEEKYVVLPGSWKYDGLVVALINGETISQAEHYCLYLKECGNVTFIGTTSSGSNGNVTNLALPGGVLVGFTGN
jgi:C-terminal processing protease CtpA/Prc